MPETRTDCFAWSLIPNHFHLLLRTGAVPIEVLMNRLLTGYSGWFNKKYKRNGQLFQNRYKSFLCQEDFYLKAGGYDFVCAVQRVAQVLNIRPDEVT
jgi:putative transposase